MPILPNILLVATPDLSQKQDPSQLPRGSGAGGNDQFNDLMNRAVSTAAIEKPSVDTPSAEPGNFKSSKTGATPLLNYSYGSRYVPSIPVVAVPTSLPVPATEPEPASQIAKPPQPVNVGKSKPYSPMTAAAYLPEAANQNPITTKVLSLIKSAGDEETLTQPRKTKSTKSDASTTQTQAPQNAPAANTSFILQPEINSTILSSATVAAPIPVPFPAAEESNKTADISVVGMAAGFLSASTGGKNFSAQSTKVSDASVLQNRFSSEVAPAVPKEIEPKSAAASDAELLANATPPAAKTSGSSALTEQPTSPIDGVDAKLPSVESVAKLMAPSSPAEQNPLPAQQTNSAGQAPSIIDGTPSALDVESMNSGGKPDKSADLAGKILPGSIAVVAHGNDLTPASVQTASTAAASAMSPNNSPAAANVSAAAGVGGITAGELRLQALESTHDLVAAHAMRLNNGENNTLSVVINPGRGTQLSLELRQHSDGVEVQAALQRGDYQHLNQNWPDLQHRLEQRGIRLAPLTDQGAFASGGGGQFKRQSTQPDETSTAPGFASTQTAIVTQPAPQARAATGWETWA